MVIILAGAFIALFVGISSKRRKVLLAGIP